MASSENREREERVAVVTGAALSIDCTIAHNPGGSRGRCEDWHLGLDVCLTGPFLGAKYAIPLMVRAVA